jgi:hypothetical protein
MKLQFSYLQKYLLLFPLPTGGKGVRGMGSEQSHETMLFYAKPEIPYNEAPLSGERGGAIARGEVKKAGPSGPALYVLYFLKKGC